MWATAEESSEQIVGLYHRAWAHSDATIDALALEAGGHVPWWPDDRHAGPADIVRELIDGAAGLRDGNDNMAAGDQGWW